LFGLFDGSPEEFFFFVHVVELTLHHDVHQHRSLICRSGKYLRCLLSLSSISVAI
jgi:hypothetical protein